MKIYEIIKNPSLFLNTIDNIGIFAYLIVFVLIGVFTKISYWVIGDSLIAKDRFGKIWLFFFCLSLGLSWAEIFTDILMVVID